MNRSPSGSELFDYETLEPGKIQQFRYAVVETYLGNPVSIPVTIINGAQPGKTVFLAGIHGDSWVDE